MESKRRSAEARLSSILVASALIAGSVLAAILIPALSSAPGGARENTLNSQASWGRSEAAGAPSVCSNCVLESIPVGMFPYGVAWDSSNADLYVADQDSDNVTIISGTTDSVVGSVTVPTSGGLLSFNPRNGDVYVSGTGGVAIISGATNAVLATLSLSDATGSVFDPENGAVYVAYAADDGSVGGVNVYSGSTDALIATIPLSGVLNVGGPQGIAYDSANGDVYVTNMGEGIVTVISGGSNTIVSNISGFNRPIGAAFDGSNDDIYVTDQNGDDVSVVSGSTNTLVGVVSSYPGGTGPSEISYDSATGLLYVANTYHDPYLGGGPGSVTVISSSNAVLTTIPTGSMTTGVVYDGANGYVYATNSNSNNVSVISPSSVVTPPVNATSQPSSTATWFSGPSFLLGLGIGGALVGVTVAVAARLQLQKIRGQAR